MKQLPTTVDDHKTGLDSYSTMVGRSLMFGPSKLMISAPPTRRLSNDSATTFSAMDVYHFSGSNCEVTIIDPFPSRAYRTIRSIFEVSVLIGVVGKLSRASSSVVVTWLINYRRFEGLGPICVLCFTKLTPALQDRYHAASKYTSLTSNVTGQSWPRGVEGQSHRRLGPGSYCSSTGQF